MLKAAEADASLAVAARLEAPLSLVLIVFLVALHASPATVVEGTGAVKLAKPENVSSLVAGAEA